MKYLVTFIIVLIFIFSIEYRKKIFILKGMKIREYLSQKMCLKNNENPFRKIDHNLVQINNGTKRITIDEIEKNVIYCWSKKEINGNKLSYDYYSKHVSRAIGWQHLVVITCDDEGFYKKGQYIELPQKSGYSIEYFLLIIFTFIILKIIKGRGRTS